MNGDTMQGRRLPDLEEGKPFMLEAGDYQKIGGVWWARAPKGPIAALTDHQITEHDDGTVTVSPSILWPDKWHGYLERGVWREV